MNSFEIRTKFFDFFIKNGHTKIPSSSLIPAEDPTLLFANAGMNQFKDVFLGKEKRSYTRAVSIQKCIRAGGKHNDLENVGFTQRHLTFFEMMGNFSFGDYFKKEAIQFAWEFLTQELQIPAETLYASVYTFDDEAYQIWHKIIGLPADKIVRLGAKDNFWQMGDTGPCGPCSEIYVDRGPKFSCQSDNCMPGCHCDRFLEIWNLVFMQFDRQSDGTDKPLQQTGVDTGMGLERLCAVIQNKESVFETDLFTDIITETERLTGKSYKNSTPDIQAAFRVIADHIRSSCFAIADGCTPSNEGRGYVLRKIIRRAALFAQKLIDKNFFTDVGIALIKQMSPIYPELALQEKLILKILRSEIEKFSNNLVHGQAILEKYFKEILSKNGEKKISGEQAFKLYDTYGFPLELTKVIAQERGFTVDTKGFEKEMEKQKTQSGKKEITSPLSLDAELKTEFTGYTELRTEAQIIALLVDSTLVEQVPQNETCWIITDRSPFYVESGGQVSDQGWIIINEVKVPVKRLKKIGNALAEEIAAPEALSIGQTIMLTIDPAARLATMKNHTATHLLQSGLMKILGKGVRQAGSLVTPDYLRFDFTYPENLTPTQITQIENFVNNIIMENIPVKITETTYKNALEQGVIAFFGEKYNPEKVRVVQVNDISAELCGGTHVRATGDIGCFKITEVSALGAGNRRIVALTGQKGLMLYQECFSVIKSLGQEFSKSKPTDVLEAVHKMREQCKTAQAELKNIKKQLLKTQIPVWLVEQHMIDHLPFFYKTFKDLNAEEVRELAQELVKSKSGLYFVVSNSDKQALFAVALSPDLIEKFDLKKFALWLKEHGLQGGVSATFIQGGAQRIAPDFETKVKEWIKNNSQS